MLGQTSVDHGVVLVVGGHHSGLDPLVRLIFDEALTWGKVGGAVHLGMRSLVFSIQGSPSHGVLLESSLIGIEVAKVDLTASPALSGEWLLLDMHDLVPIALVSFQVKLLAKWLRSITDHLLGSDWRMVDGSKILSCVLHF